MIAEIVSIGDELLIGQVINTNASWMAEQLNLAGISVQKIIVVADRKEEIKETLTNAGKRSDLVLITGGLGPTKDDITKDTLCEYFNSKLVFSEEVYNHIIQLFHIRSLNLSERNRKQAEIPDACNIIKNNQGTAPGMWFEKDNVIYVSMPGVPFEMKAMMADYIIPMVSERNNMNAIVHKTILTQGVGESWLAERISDWEENLPKEIKLAYLPQPGIVRLRLTASGNDPFKLKTKVEIEIEKLKTIIPELIFGYNEDTLEQVVGILLKENNYTLSTAESCTGGYIAHLLTSISGSSAYFKGSVVAYSNEIKEHVLGVKNPTLINHGAVSEEVVLEMARQARKKFNTNFSIAVSGIAGPDGGTDEKPVGTVWIGLATPNTCFARKYQFGEHRGRNIRRSAITALNMLRLEILKAQSL
jgi:nicotinamide-nucleotide amidase